MNVNLAATYFSGQEPTGQINFLQEIGQESSIHITMKMMTKHQIKRENNKNMAIVSSCYQRAKNFLAHKSLQQTVKIHSTNAIHAKKGMSLLPMLPRSLPVCRMFWLSSCMYRKQSFNTRMNSVTQNQKMACQRPRDQKIFSVTTLGSFGSSASSL